MSDYGNSAVWNFKTGAGQNAANQIADMQYAANLQKQNEAMALAKAKLFSQDVQFNSGSNQYDAPLIQTENQKMLEGLGKFRRENPDWATNPEKMGQLNYLKQSFKSTPAVLRSAAYKDAVSKLNNDLSEVAKNPTRYNLKAYESLKQQVDNYNKYGNQMGKDAADAEGAKAFVYQRPADFIDETKLAMDLGKSFKAFDDVPLYNGRLNAYKQVPNEKELEKMAYGTYLQNKDQYDQKYTEKGIDPIQGLIDEITPHIGGQRFEGYDDNVGEAKKIMDYKAKLAAASANPNEDIYKTVIYDSASIAPSDPTDLAAAFGSTPTVTYKDANGKTITESGNTFTWTELTDKNYRGVNPKTGQPYPYQKDGLKVGRGFILKPVEYGKELGVLYDDKFFGEKLKVKPENEDSYSIFTTPDGKEYLKIKAETEVNAANPASSRKYNARVKSTTKQREGAGVGDMTTQQVYEDEVGNKFVLDSNGQPVPYQ